MRTLRDFCVQRVASWGVITALETAVLPAAAAGVQSPDSAGGLLYTLELFPEPKHYCSERDNSVSGHCLAAGLTHAAYVSFHPGLQGTFQILPCLGW